MTVEFIPEISNPELTTDSRYGGDVMINIRSLLNDIDVSPLFEGWRPKFRTQLLFRSGTIAMLDEDSSNEVHIYVDDIINKDGNVNLHIPAFTDDDDTIILQNHPQQINYKVLGESITVAADIDFNTNAILDATISGTSNTITDIQKSSLPSTTVYTDQPNTYGTFLQTFITGFLRIQNASNFVGLASAVQSGNYNLNIPLLTGNDTIATLGVANTFTAIQTINAGTDYAVKVQRDTSQAGLDVGIEFNEKNDADEFVRYAALLGGIVSNADGSEDGQVKFKTLLDGTLGTVLVANHVGNLIIGRNQRLCFSEGSLSALRVFTFPNEAGQVTVNEATQILLNKTISTGWTITGDVAVNNASGLHITKNAGSGVAEVLFKADIADDALSYLQIDNATPTDTLFVPRITALHSSTGNSPGLYVYSNISAAADNTTTNGVIVLDSRRSTGAALTTRPILDIRNFTTNIARFSPNETWIYNHLRVQAKSGTTDFENILELTTSDAPSCYMKIGNSYNTNTVFAPILTSFNGAAAATSSMTAFHIRSMVLPANDTGSLAVNIIEGRRSDTSALTSRGILALRNLNTDQYVFYPTFLDLLGNHIQMTKIAQPSTPAAGKVKLWVDSTSGKWSQIDEAGTVTTFGSGGGGASAMDDLTDADTTTSPPTINDVLTWDGSNWVPAVPPGAGGGEANTISNVGTGVELAKTKVGVDIPLRTLLGDVNFELTQNTDDITFAIKNVGAFKYSIFKEGSTYYLRNNMTGTIEVSNAAPDTVFQTALTNGGDTYVYDADYEFTAASSPVLSMPLYPLYARLYLGQNVNLIVPQGYTGVLLQFRHAAVGGAGVSRCKISGGNMKEGGTRQELWTAIQFYGDASVSVAGLFWNVVEELQIWYPKKGIHLLNASGGTKCFFNQNIFRNVIIWYPIEDGVHFDMQNAYVVSTNGFHRNRFEYVTIQGAGVTTNPNATVGFRDIRHKDNSFIGCYPVDFTGDAKTATIHADAVSTEIFGGTMDALGYVNNSNSTKAITESGRITTNGIIPSNGSNLETIMGSSATTLTWSFWNSTFTDRFYIQKNDTTNQYLFDFVKQNGGALKPALFRMYDASTGGTGVAESFRIETDGGLRVYTNKLRLRDANNTHNFNILVNDISADRNIEIPSLTADDEFAMTDFPQTFLNKIINESSNTIVRREDYTYQISPYGATDFRVKRGSDGAIVYTSSNGGTADALGALQYCRDALGNTSPGGVVELSEGYFPVSAKFTLNGANHRYQTYRGKGNGSNFGPLSEIRATGDFPAIEFDGTTGSVLGIGIESLNLSHDEDAGSGGYNTGLIRCLNTVVECTFKDIAFSDQAGKVGSCFSFEILDTTAIQTQYSNKIFNCNCRGFDNFITVNNQANNTVHGSFMSTLDISNCTVWNTKRILSLDGVSGALVLDWHFHRVTFQHDATNTVAANEGIFDYDSPVSCFQHKHNHCMVWDITAPGINYANVGTSVELALEECNPTFRIGGSGAYLNKVKTNEYYTGGSSPMNTGYAVVSSTTSLGEGLLVGTTIPQTPTIQYDSISPYLRFASGSTPGTNTGPRRGPAIFRMEHSPLVEIYAGPDNTGASRCYHGIGTNVSASLPGDTDVILGTTDQGIYAGWRTTDTNIQIFHHNGDGTAMSVIDTGLAKTTTMWKCAFLIDATGFSWKVATVNGSKVGTRVTTKVPAQGVSMALSCAANPSTSTSINQNFRYATVKLRNL